MGGKQRAIRPPLLWQLRWLAPGGPNRELLSGVVYDKNIPELESAYLSHETTTVDVVDQYLAAKSLHINKNGGGKRHTRHRRKQASNAVAEGQPQQRPRRRRGPSRRLINGGCQPTAQVSAARRPSPGPKIRTNATGMITTNRREVF